MVKPHFHSNVRQLLGEDFSELLHEISPFVEPRIDLYQTNRNFIISIDLAGARKEDFSVKQRNYTLLIEGTINRNHLKDRFKIIQSERFYGSFRREISLPEECHLEQLQAVFDRGILVITIPVYQSKEKDEI
ncbi:Hsp20/alpha crystallin family protein [Bacillus sp. EB600]|uniref:Hsp20/alpha crystallin family protein n=1 Tax=Bacillus sp. EB600 TaxID=2806345 RepID=UPI00210C05D0|nr:Hsp20/alpha crystallin family protein [Bacillus sp. EB600]MCQ6280779.1 Hsp20/alpha crystallin family protein [Bacillus sp. EB600]